jgi:hypothetical protein
MKVDFAWDLRGRQPAREVVDSWTPDYRGKIKRMLAGFEVVNGHVNNGERFKRLGPDLFEFKCHQARMLGDFRPGGRFIVAHALIKKAHMLHARELEVARKVLKQNDAFESGVRRAREQEAAAAAAAPEPAPDVATTPATEPQPEAGLVWGLMRPEHRLAIDAPLMQSLLPRSPHAAGISEEQVRAFVEERLRQESPLVRISIDKNDPRLILGALIGLEFGLAVAAHNRAVEDAAHVQPPSNGNGNGHHEEPAPEVSRFEVVLVRKTATKRNRPLLAKILGEPAPGRVCCTTFQVKRQVWTAPYVLPRDHVVGPADLSSLVPYSWSSTAARSVAKITVAQALALLETHASTTTH